MSLNNVVDVLVLSVCLLSSIISVVCIIITSSITDKIIRKRKLIDMKKKMEYSRSLTNLRECNGYDVMNESNKKSCEYKLKRRRRKRKKV